MLFRTVLLFKAIILIKNININLPATPFFHKIWICLVWPYVLIRKVIIISFRGYTRYMHLPIIRTTDN